MRELKIVGLDLDGKHILCEGDDPGEKYRIRVDDRLRAAVRGDGARVNQTHIDIEVSNMLRPKDIQARIRAGASVEQLAESAGVDIAKVERFAHPVLLERARAAELATAAHPVLSDGPAVLTLLETVTSSLVARGLNPDGTAWDAWRNEDGRWTVQLGWKAGRSDNVAHFRYCPGAHGGTVTALDDTAKELIDPDFDRPLLRPVAPLAQLDFDEPEVPAPAPVVEAAVVTDGPEPEPKAEQTRARRGKPAVPAWEDVLLGVRSSGQR
jgi:hypothetical protein